MQHQEARVDSGSLLQRLQAGEPSAVHDLVQNYGGRLMGFLRCLVHSQEIAEDLAQETIIRVYQKCGQVKSPERFDTWLFTLARNIAYKELARKHYQRELPQETEWFDELQSQSATHPMMKLTAEDAGRLLQAALSTLDEKRREIMAMRYYSGLSLQEIAEVLHLPLGSIGTTITRSLASLKKYFDARGLKVEDII